MNPTYERYVAFRRKLADLSNTQSILSWDQEVNMPIAGAGMRAQQMATLSGIIHEMSTSAEAEELLATLSVDQSLSFKEQRNIAESYKRFRKNKKLSREFVERYSHAVSEAYQSWMQARQADSFSMFSPELHTMVELEREKASLYGYEDHPYDALLDDYEPGLTTAEVQKVFDDVRQNLGSFYDKIKDQPKPDQSFFSQEFDKETQLALCRELITRYGYDWDAGRLDLSEHPFSTSFAPTDSRITTRVNNHDLRESVWGSLHETGHALYEQGLPLSEYGLPSGSPVSLSIHESQSRLWENNVGKSSEYIHASWPLFTKYFPQQLKAVGPDKFFRGLNAVVPDLIRINSDEVTYHFHILLRFEIEKALIEGNLQVNELEAAWNEKIRKYLYLDVPSPKKGVIQDIHWSHGSFGYFPTYSLGSFYAAQFFAAASHAAPEMKNEIGKMNFNSLLSWLRTNIHSHGHTYSSQELCKMITGEELNYKYFNDYLYAKYSLIYQV